MIKKLTAAVAAIAVAVQAAAGVFAADSYYIKKDRKSITADDIKHVPYDITHIEKIYDEINDLIDEPNNDINISTLLDSCYSEYIKASDQYSYAMLESDRNYNNETVQTAADAYNTAVDASKIMADTFELIYYSDYDYVLDNILGAEGKEECMESIPSERFYELSREEQALVDEYEKKFGNSDACAALYVKLVKVRNDIAKEQGYTNYADYSQAVYERDYGAEELKVFCDAVAQYMKPVALKFSAPISLVDAFYVESTEDEVKKNLSSVLHLINGELGDTYDYMISSGLCDLSFSSKKSQANSSYTLPLVGLDSAFLLLNPYEAYEADSASSVSSLIHESGHFCAIANDPATSEPWYYFKSTMSIDTSEVHSQGLEALSRRYYGRLFRSDAPYEYYKNGFTLISNILDGCFFNEWQTRVYNEENLTVERCNEIAVELLNKYYSIDYTTAAAQKVWTGVHHNFTSPMYYIAYAVSAAEAMQLFTLSKSDYEGAVDKYMKVSAKGCYVPFKQTMQEAGFEDIFKEETIKQLAADYEDVCGMGYTDVNYDAWYAEYLYSTSMIFDGMGDNLFMPDTNITRGDFIKLLASMYDYYIGIDGSYTTVFNDVAPASSYSRAIGWAKEMGIAEGYSDTWFGANDSITREQLVTMLYRLATYEFGYVKGDPETEFADMDMVSSWAKNAMNWAISAEIINGKDDNRLDPQGNATRAESAKIASCYVNYSY